MRDLTLKLAREEGESSESIQLSRYHVESWFNKREVKTYRPTALIYLGDNQKSYRMTWAREMGKMVGDKKSLVCFIEKLVLYHWTPKKAQALTSGLP